MNHETFMCCIVAFLLGMLLSNMLKNICDCNVIEGQTPDEPAETTEPDEPASPDAVEPAKKLPKNNKSGTGKDKSNGSIEKTLMCYENCFETCQKSK